MTDITRKPEPQPSTRFRKIVTGGSPMNLLRLTGIAVLTMTVLVCQAESADTTKIGYHQVRTDAEGHILPWYSAELGTAYDHNLRLVWSFWKGIDDCPNGVRYCLQHQVWKPKHDRRGVAASQFSMTISSWNLLYGYTGDRAVLDDMVFITDYLLSHGMSKPDAQWPNLPYPYNTDIHSGVYDGDMKAGKDVLQPDKAADFGAELVVLYKITGTRKYLDAAVAIADTLADKVAAGDADHSPWPFRVNAQTGNLPQGVSAEYTSNWTGALRLFDDLIRLEVGKRAAYAKARETVTAWLKQFPMKTNKWGPYFEDVPTYSDTEINAGTMALYILDHPEWDATWKQDARAILDWSAATFGNPKWAEYGVLAIDEQTQYRVPGNSHTARHASDELLYCERSGDTTRKAAAIRQLNWATYWVDDDGENRYPENDIWLTDGYVDYVRHYLRAMASCPELAPVDQNHLLRTSSVVQNIQYDDGAVTYTKFDARSSERLKFGAWTPRLIKGGTMIWNKDSKVLEVEAIEKTVIISQ